jgi:hypothetical protein
MSVDIDWTIVLVETPIARYLSKYDGIGLSLTNKRIRAKLYPKIFNDIFINLKILRAHSNYYNQKKYHQFDNLTYMEKIKLVKKYGFNKDLAFKKVQIDPFIEEANNTLSSVSTYCESLSLYNLKRSCYFLFPIFDNYINLSKLSLRWCDVPFSNFANLITKLKKLEILVMECINLILSKSEDSNLARNLKYPISLKAFDYLYINLGITNCYELTSREIIRNTKFEYYTEKLEINPQILPSLKHFKCYFGGRGNVKMEEFKALNPNALFDEIVLFWNDSSLINND